MFFSTKHCDVVQTSTHIRVMDSRSTSVAVLVLADTASARMAIGTSLTTEICHTGN